MKFAIIALAIVLVGLRIWRHRYAKKTVGTPEESAGHPTRHRSDIELIARREVHERVTSRVFRVGTLIVLLGVAAAVVIPVIRKSGPPVAHVGIVGPTTALVTGTLHATGAGLGVSVRITDESSLGAAEGALQKGRVDVVVVDDHYLLVDQGITPSDTSSLALFTEAVSRYLGSEVALAKAGVPPSRIGALTVPRRCGSPA